MGIFRLKKKVELSRDSSGWGVVLPLEQLVLLIKAHLVFLIFIIHIILHYTEWYGVSEVTHFNNKKEKEQETWKFFFHLVQKSYDKAKAKI